MCKDIVKLLGAVVIFVVEIKKIKYIYWYTLFIFVKNVITYYVEYSSLNGIEKHFSSGRLRTVASIDR